MWLFHLNQIMVMICWYILLMIELNDIEWRIGFYWRVIINDHCITATIHEVDVELFVWEPNIKAARFGCYFGGVLDS